jgi:hypothetical protein
MKLTGIRCLGFAATGAVAAFLLVAPSAEAAGPVKRRAERQQDRIAQGVKSGQLNARETARLEGRESALNHEVRDMRKLDGGKLTPKDKAVVNQQQNRLSNQIYNQKHDAQTQGQPKTEIGERKENQQDRIGQGIQSGELTAGEASRLEGKETALNQETRDMRKLDGGKLTPQDKALVNQQQNKLSKQIYNQKHDAQTQPN